jgi:hypothetical protein
MAGMNRFAIVSMFVTMVAASAAADGSDASARAIADLQQKSFPLPPCAGAAAKLNRAEAAAAIEGTDRVVALLDCPAAKVGEQETIVAVFGNAATDAPVCFGHLKLMDNSGNFILGKVKSVEVRKLGDALVVVPSLAGGDASGPWTSQAFLRMDDKCALTLLAKFHSRMHYDEDDTSKCEGTKHTYKFLSSSTVEIRRDKVHCTATAEVAETTAQTFDLDAMVRNPQLRVVEP